MNPVAFLLISLGISLLGGVGLWLRHRQPRAYDSGIKEFRREMQALAPPEQVPGRSRRRGRR